ncbi:hypothetical protein ACJJTC_002483 [Scirpophaga incertulas]
MKFACCESGEEGANNELLMCVKCKLNFHFKCLYPTDSRSNITSELKKKWICPKCSASGPKRNSDNTPVRCNSGGPSNINTKRGASSHNSSPPSTSGQDYLTTSTEVIRSIISSEVEKLRLELLKSLTDTFSNQLKLIRDDVTKLQEAVNFVNSQHEDMLAKLDKINAEDESPLVQCSTCLGYGHGKKYCTETEIKCSHCGGQHRQDQCEEKVKGTIPVCVNCASEKHSDVGHNAFSASCPIRRKWDSIARARVAYN